MGICELYNYDYAWFIVGWWWWWYCDDKGDENDGEWMFVQLRIILFDEENIFFSYQIIHNLVMNSSFFSTYTEYLSCLMMT